ncbi:MAG: MASE3 domain-containing protein, partial [Phycisphaerae bacterium]
MSIYLQTAQTEGLRKLAVATKWAILVVVAFLGLHLASEYNYLLFHGLAEGFSIVVACGMFMLAWNSRRILDNDYLLLLGIAYLFVGIVDAVHTLAYSGMGVFPGFTTNLPTQLWISARYMETLTLLAAPLALRWHFRPVRASVLIGLATALLLVAIFNGVFPDCFVPGQGLTPFKVISEYIICALLLVAAWLLYRNRKAFEPAVVKLLLGSVLLTVGSELMFT